MGDDKKLSREHYDTIRREKRFGVPDIYSAYIEMKVKVNDAFLPVALLDFSRHGIKLKSAEPIESGSLKECVVTISRSLTRDIHFSVRIKRCERVEDAFVVGVEIEEIADPVWFTIVQEVHDFILDRAGDVF